MKLYISIVALMIITHLSFSQVGTLDTAFDIGSGASSNVESIAIQPDGKIIIAGSFTSYNGTSINRLARLHPDGSLDNSFNIGSGPSGIVYKVKVLPNGKIFIAGSISRYNDQDCDFIVKLNSDGSRDTSFTVVHNSNQSSPAYDFHVLPDGKVLLAGILNDFAESGTRTLVRLNADGSHDTTFNLGGAGFEANIAGVTPYIKTIDVQSDGKILVGGFFFRYNGVNSRYIARIDQDGSLDTTFQNGNTTFSGPSNEITAITVLDNDKILVGGENSSYNGDSVKNLMRLNADGTLDNAFSVLDAYNNYAVGISSPSQIAVASNGNIVVVGSRTSINGNPAKSIVLYDANGSLNTDFNAGMGLGPNSKLETCAIQEDGKILIGGIFQFNMYDTTPTNRLARINTGGILGVHELDLTTDTSIIYPNPSDHTLFISSKNSFIKYSIYSQIGQKIESNRFMSSMKIPIDHLNTGIYYLELIGSDRSGFTKFIKK
ncbi:T9SS type A sorting domain-containing protein [Sungkyunkwania multivorans]|uniref:T9SS type A sorting domain-containing protein n=1 Tax=Sungkyunkwania multivorans TaxID=1173618 RepID=A0ABW3D0D0_9FLAO